MRTNCLTNLRAVFACLCAFAVASSSAQGDVAHAATTIGRLTRKTAPSRWHAIDMPNFRIYSHGPRPLDRRVATQVEAVRSRVLQSWFADDDSERWTPKCSLVLHGTLASYRQCVPELADRTIASCAIRADKSGVLERRIDVRIDCPCWLEHLPHELTHMALDGHVTAATLPRWADEGMATMADPPAKKALHWRDLSAAFDEGEQYRLVDLLTIDSYPASERLGVFYGQSLSLMEFLVDRGGRPTLVDFLKQALHDGYDRALRSTYDIDGVADLEAQWSAYARRIKAASASARASDGTSSLLESAAGRGD